jgi:anhydro-N-acetylmuramic acid kinase
MQLGDPGLVAVRTGIATVADFRRADMALGGQGAPFAPAFHRFVFGDLPGKTAVVNLGGMANVTVLGDPLLGYDTGPGNVLMDNWCRTRLGMPFDRDGATARTGRVDEAMLEAMRSDPYFSLPAPKSTGREYFDDAWLERFDPGLRRAEDVLATLAELTAATVADAVRDHRPRRLLLCGGGVENAYLVERIAARLEGVEVAPTDDYGVPHEWMEAMAFAWLAYKRMQGEPVALRSVTGAERDAVLGGIYFGVNSEK